MPQPMRRHPLVDLRRLGCALQNPLKRRVDHGVPAPCPRSPDRSSPPARGNTHCHSPFSSARGYLPPVPPVARPPAGPPPGQPRKADAAVKRPSESSPRKPIAVDPAPGSAPSPGSPPWSDRASPPGRPRTVPEGSGQLPRRIPPGSPPGALAPRPAPRHRRGRRPGLTALPRQDALEPSPKVPASFPEGSGQLPGRIPPGALPGALAPRPAQHHRRGRRPGLTALRRLKKPPQRQPR
jgi:hypothetical protein